MVYIHVNLSYLLGQVTDQESLFFYEDNENSSTYAIEDHDPPFLDEITDELLANPQLTSVCGDHVLCLFDYNQTGDPAIGIDTAYFDQLSTFYKELNCKYNVYIYIYTPKSWP